MRRLARNILKILRKNLQSDIHNLKFLLGQNAILSSRSMANQFKYLWEAEVKVFSQWGEDGILDYISNRLEIVKPRILEIGAGNFTECNSRFLAENRNASVVLVDGRKDLILNVNSNSLKWKTHLYAIETWVTPLNVNELIEFSGNNLGGIDIFSLDLDGNDYWILEVADLSSVRVVVVEYNPLFGSTYAVSVPRDDNFDRTNKHQSCIYYGASLKAFIYLLDKKGFSFIGTNRVGNNAFFIETGNFDKIATVLPDNLSEHTDWRIRESRDSHGNLSFVSGADRVLQISEMPVIEVETGKELTVGSLFS
jgi:hypothetical protein